MSVSNKINNALLFQDKDKLSSKQMKTLLSLTLDNGLKIVDKENPSQLVNVIELLTTYDTYDEAINYMKGVSNSMELGLYSPANKDAIEDVKIKRNIASREAPTAKTGYGKCPKCGNANLIGTTQQMRSGDEGMNLLLSCPILSCGYRSKR